MVLLAAIGEQMDRLAWFPITLVVGRSVRHDRLLGHVLARTAGVPD